MVGAGATSGGTMDLANLVKPALMPEQVSACIGSTTFEEFKHIEKDRALAPALPEDRGRGAFKLEDTVKILEGSPLALRGAPRGRATATSALEAAVRLASAPPERITSCRTRPSTSSTRPARLERLRWQSVDLNLHGRHRLRRTSKRVVARIARIPEKQVSSLRQGAAAHARRSRSIASSSDRTTPSTLVSQRHPRSPRRAARIPKSPSAASCSPDPPVWGRRSWPSSWPGTWATSSCAST